MVPRDDEVCSGMKARFPERHARPARSAGGFTLVELTVALGVLAVITAVVVPMYVSKLPEMRLKAAARTLVGDLRYARSLAVANDRPYFVCFGGAGAYQVDRVEDPATAADCASANTPTEMNDDLAARFPGVAFGYAAGLPDCPGGGGAVADPVVFASDRAVFTAKGASMTGTGAGAGLQATGLVYLTSTDTSPQATYCVQVQGAVGNVRLLEWDAGAAAWVQ
jgi:type II secretory pathway pseudopilin PulG